MTKIHQASLKQQNLMNFTSEESTLRLPLLKCIHYSFMNVLFKTAKYH